MEVSSGVGTVPVFVYMYFPLALLHLISICAKTLVLPKMTL